MTRFLCTLLTGVLACSGIMAQVVINEIIAPNTVELKNLGAGTVNISGYYLCDFPVYDQVGPTTCGVLNLPAGAIVTVTTSINISGADGEMGLYLNNSNFGNPANIIDYVEWGSANHTRASTAEAAGIWPNDGNFVPAWTGCASIEYDGSGDTFQDWVAQDVATTGCMENSLDGCGGASCDLTSTGLNNVDCNNNGTVSDPVDDYITFTLNPQGTDLATTYDVSVNQGTVNPTSAAYGGPINFSLQSGSAGSGNVIVTVTDNDDISCTAMATIIDPGTCSSDCNLTGAGLSGVVCDDNGTPGNPGDDVIIFTLNPTGDNTAATYNVMVSSGSVNPTSAAYGGATMFALQAGSAGGGNVVVTVIDADDAGCTINANIIDPGACSDACSLTSAGLSNVGCDANGTASDPGDDFIIFSLDPQGANLGATYDVAVSSGSVNPTSASYGAPTVFTLQAGSAGSGNVMVTVSDGSDPTCQTAGNVVDPGTCSNACDITALNLANVACNDNGTDMDSVDDYITFTLEPQGINLGATYNVSVDMGSVNPTSAAYGVVTMFALNGGSAGAGNVVVTVTDVNDAGCSEQITIVDPGVCSNDCTVDGGMISTGDETVVCAGDGMPDNITPVLTGAIGDLMAWVITNTDGIIQSLPASPPFDFDGAGNGISLIWNISYEAGLMGLNEGNDIDDLMGCFAFSNALEVIHAQPAGGMIMTDDPTQVCTDDGIADTIEVTVSGNVGSNSAWVITNQAGVILDLPAGPPFSFEGSASGTCRIWHLSYEDGLTGLEVDANLSGLMGCYDLSNVITIVKQTGEDCNPCDADGGVISTMDSTNVCVGDGVADPIGAVVTGNTGPVNTWVITDGMGMILALPASMPFNFEGLDAGMCRIWHISYEIGLQGLALNGDLGNLMGCFDLSNAIEVTKLQPEGGSISTSDTTTVCAGDGLPDLVNVARTGASGGNSAWVITDTMGMILSLPMASPFDFEEAGAGVSVIWSLSYEDGLTGLEVGNNVSGLMGCYDFSDSIRVTRLTTPECGMACSVDGGMITTGDDTTICVGDNVTDTVEVSVTGATGMESRFVMTDTAGMIISVSTAGAFTFETLGAGTSVLYHLSYNEPISGLTEGENIADLDGCFELSNAIQVMRVTAGDDCISATLDPELQQHVRVYPNPALRDFRVVSTGPMVRRIQVFSAAGQQINDIWASGLTVEVDAEHWNGLYYLRIYTDIGVAVKKVVVLQY